MRQRPLGLTVIIIYKAFVALLLAITAIFLLLALKNYQNLADFSESYLLKGKLHIIEFVLEIIHLKDKPSFLVALMLASTQF